MSVYAPRPLLWAFTGPLASHVFAREFGAAAEELAGRYELAGDTRTARQIRDAVSQWRESARQRKERQRELDVQESNESRSACGEALSSCESSGLMTPEEVAGQVGVSAQAVRGWCRSGDLSATRVAARGRPWVVAVEDLNEFLEQRKNA